MLGSAVAIVYVVEGIEDFKNPAAPLWFTVAGELVFFLMALVALGMGVPLLKLGWTGRSSSGITWIRALLIGIGCFFPGFIFSMPLTVLWAQHTWPGDGQSVFAAAEVSFYVGIGAVVVYWVVVFAKRVRSI